MPTSPAAIRQAIGAARASRTARGAAWSLGTNMAGLGMSFGVQIVLTRALGPATYGVYAFALAWMNILLLAGKLQFDDTAVRYVAAYAATEERSLLRGFLHFGGRVVLWASIGVALGEAVVAAVAPIDPAVRHALWAAALLLPLTGIAQFRASALQALKHVRESQIPPLILRPALFALGLLVVLLAYGRGSLSAAQAVLLNAGAAAVALGVTAWLYRARLPHDVAVAQPEVRGREWIHSALGFLLLAAAQTVLGTQTDVIIVGSLLSKTDAAHYSVATQLASLVGIGVTSLMFVLLPGIAARHARGDRDGLAVLVRNTGWAGMALSLPVVLFLTLLGPRLLAIFGPTYPAAQPLLVVLAISQGIAASFGALAGFLMTMTGRQYQASLLVAASAAFNLALSFVLTKHYGAIGTALATAIAVTVRSVVLGTYLYRRCGITIVPLWLSRPTI